MTYLSYNLQLESYINFSGIGMRDVSWRVYHLCLVYINYYDPSPGISLYYFTFHVLISEDITSLVFVLFCFPSCNYLACVGTVSFVCNDSFKLFFITLLIYFHPLEITCMRGQCFC